MKSVELVFQEFRYEVLTILSNEEGETNFETILTTTAKLTKRPKEDLDTGHGLVKAVYDLTELDLITKSGPHNRSHLPSLTLMGGTASPTRCESQ